MADLLELAARCEAFEGPDHDPELNDAIHDVLPEPKCVQPPNYCASIDAAMKLVPEGMYPNIDCEPGAPEVEIYSADNPHGAKGISYTAGTAALALCAAALKARANQEKKS